MMNMTGLLNSWTPSNWSCSCKTCTRSNESPAQRGGETGETQDRMNLQLSVGEHRIKWIYSLEWEGTRSHESMSQRGGGAQDQMHLQLSIGRGSPAPTPKWGALNSWQLLRKEESKFFKEMAPDRSTTLQRMGIQLRAAQHNSWAAQTRLNEFFFKWKTRS